jgi:hypothetical protein
MGARSAVVSTVALVFLTTIVSAFAQDSFSHERRATAKETNRYGDVPLGAVIRTDERYNQNGLFQGPRGWAYWNYLPNPKPYQNPNLWPDRRPIYFFGQLVMPAGCSLTIRGRYPYARYFKFNLYKFERNTFVAIPGASLAGYDIKPDAGSSNPYKIGADRLLSNRNFTLHVLANEPPANAADRPKNTLYVGRDGKEVQAGFCIYVSDKGYDGAGWGPADTPSLDGPGVSYEGKLADGTQLSSEDVVKQWGRPMGSAPPPLRVDQWYKLVDAKDNDPALTPATAPARRDAEFELFWGMKYTLAGAFMKPEELIDPDGNVYVLPAHEEEFPIDSLAKLGEKLKLPTGWKFRTRDLNEDLVLDLKSDQTIYAIGDEYHQYWTRIPNFKAN